MALRLRAVALLAASLGAQLLAILTLGWFREPPELETRLVKPPPPRLDAPRADDAEAPQPRVLN
jgi:hypothetical protein